MKENITSPYLRLKYKTKNSYIFINYLLDKIVHISHEDYNLLSEFTFGGNITRLDSHAYASNIERMLQKHWMFEYNQFSSYHRLRRAEIETTTMCNWNCQYCPAAQNKRPPKVMTMESFKKILDMCVKYPSIDTICIHAYCEPTIDPLFTLRVKMIRSKGFNFELFTNGSCLSEDKIQLLSRLGNTKKLVFNFPSADEDKFYKLTGSKRHKEITKNISLSIEYGLPVFITVLSKNVDEDEEAGKVGCLFPGAYIDILKIQDRAAALNIEEYRCDIHVSDKCLYGCFYFSQILYINSDGDCFPCINDCLSLKYVYGNINNVASIKDIMESETVQSIRKKIFGLLPAEENFMCRKCVFMEKNKLNYHASWKE